MAVIDAYIAELGGALRGPEDVKADLLAEARDSLVDAADAYEAGGLDRRAAERRAVEDFGEVREIARGYQAELGLSLGRRTMLLLAGVLLAQHFLWDYGFPWVLRATLDDPASLVSHGLEAAAVVLGAVGSAASAGAVLAIVACGKGTRFLRAAAARRWITRGVGVFALTVAGFYTVAGLLLTVVNSDWALLRVHLVWTAVVLVLPMLWVAASARRTLAAT